MEHPTFKGLAETTRATRRRVLNNFRAFTTAGGRCYGENTLKGIEAKHITAAIEDKPLTVQRDWLKALRHWLAFARKQGHCKTNPTVGIEVDRPPKSDGFLTWGDEPIELYRARHPYGTMARVGIELTLNIAARRGDAFQIGRQHLRNGCLTWRPSKTLKSTGKMLTVRVLPELQAAIDAMPRTDAMPFLLGAHGRPFKSAAAFGNRFSGWVKQAGLKPVKCADGKVRTYGIHGLRKAACTRLAEAGCTAMEIMAVAATSRWRKRKNTLPVPIRSEWRTQR